MLDYDVDIKEENVKSLKFLAENLKKDDMGYVTFEIVNFLKRGRFFAFIGGDILFGKKAVGSKAVGSIEELLRTIAENDLKKISKQKNDLKKNK
jgi:hypothetical protein